MKKTFLGPVVAIVVTLLIIIGLIMFRSNRAHNNTPIACTQEAKICPDGSVVGRTGPNCEFTVCPAPKSILSEAEARTIAEKTCIKGGESLGDVIYNDGTKTWWYDANLNSNPGGCHPACVVSEDTQTAEINWRCTGLIQPE
jgi:hypothetical protein